MSSIQDVLAGLQKNYLASLPEKIANIEALWKKGDLDLLETEYHKLKGTGRTYGLPEISQLGEALEHLCDSGDKTALGQAVPISLELLKAIGESRKNGAAYPLDNDPSFRSIVSLLESVNAAQKHSQKRSS